MILSSQKLVELSKIEWQQGQKNIWRSQREKAYNYYRGRTDGYLKAYYKVDKGTPIYDKIPIPTIELTKRVINRVSLVYMNPPIREYTNEKGDVVSETLQEFTKGKDHKLQRAERLTNLLEVILFKPTWRNDLIEYDIIRDWEPIFGNDPLTPVAITYPLSVKDSVMDITPELWTYWDAENHYNYEKTTGKVIAPEDNPELANPYQILPFVECYRDGKPEASYLDTDASNGLIATNEMVNMAEFNKAANLQFQSFGMGYISGSNIDYDKLEIGPDKWSQLGHDGTLGMVSPPNTVDSISNAITNSYKLLAQNYGLDASFAEGTAAESGISRRLRMQELLDNRSSDVTRWNDIERKIFEVEKRILAVEVTQDAGVLWNVDYTESTDILSAEEQRAKWDWELANGLIDTADVLMQQDPDKYEDRQAALDFLAERSGITEEPAEASPLLAALTTPV